MSRKRRSMTHGVVTLEATLTLLPVLLALFLGLELIRRARVAVALHHGAFLPARDAVFRRSPGSRHQRLHRWLANSLGGKTRAASVAADIAGRRSGVEARLHYRYPALLSFPWKQGRKHHFEVTQTCLFPW